jgi:hypothetical protein
VAVEGHGHILMRATAATCAIVAGAALLMWLTRPDGVCGTTMAAPSYPGSTWTAGNKTNDDTFQNLDNWNFGFTDTPTSGTTGVYVPWGASGRAPYWGSGSSDTYHQNYDLPGNVSQTSTGVNPLLLSGYSPQTFRSSGCGVTLTAHYTGPRRWVTSNEGELTRSWTDGAINTFNKISFPTRGNTEFYIQIRAQMGGYQGSNNGNWDSLWCLGQGSNQREIDLQETGNQGGNSPNYINSHLQDPPVPIENHRSPYDLSAGYHTYGLQLARRVVTIYLDNQRVGAARAGATGPYFLIVNGGLYSSGLPWATGPTTKLDMNMSVAEVQVYQR